jgi:hypothetical protein
MSIVRKNLIRLSGKFFTPEPWTDPPTPEPEPSAAYCSISYYPPQPNPCPRGWDASLLNVQVPLVLQSDGCTWALTWDTSVADGKFWWAVYSLGSVVAACQGTEVIRANPANLAVA